MENKSENKNNIFKKGKWTHRKGEECKTGVAKVNRVLIKRREANDTNLSAFTEKHHFITSYHAVPHCFDLTGSRRMENSQLPA